MARYRMTTLFLGLALTLAACAPSNLESPTPPVDILPEATEPLGFPTSPPGTAASGATPIIPGTGSTAPAKTAPALTTPKAEATPAGSETPLAEPTFMRASDFIGYEIVTETGQAVGRAAEVLADEAGVVHYVLADVGDYAGVDARPSALPWSLLKVDPDKQQLVFTGTPEDLGRAVVYDPAILDQIDDVVLATEGTQLPIEFDQLIRIGRYADFDLRDLTDADLGAVNEVLVDLTQGEVSYVFVDVGAFLGTAETTVAVPWERLAVKPPETATAPRDQFVVDVTETMLRQAPTVDLDTLPAWPELIAPDWEAPIRQFWENAG